MRAISRLVDELVLGNYIDASLPRLLVCPFITYLADEVSQCFTEIAVHFLQFRCDTLAGEILEPKVTLVVHVVHAEVLKSRNLLQTVRLGHVEECVAQATRNGLIDVHGEHAEAGQTHVIRCDRGGHVQVAVELSSIIGKGAQITPMLVRAKLDDHLVLMTMEKVQVLLVVLIGPLVNQLAIRFIKVEVHSRIEVHYDDEPLVHFLQLLLEPHQLLPCNFLCPLRFHGLAERDGVETDEVYLVGQLHAIVASRHIRLFDSLGKVPVRRYVLEEDLVRLLEELAGLEGSTWRVIRSAIVQVEVVVALSEENGNALQMLLEKARHRLQATSHLVHGCARDIFLGFLSNVMPSQVSVQHNEVERLTL